MSERIQSESEVYGTMDEEIGSSALGVSYVGNGIVACKREERAIVLSIAERLYDDDSGFADYVGVDDHVFDDTLTRCAYIDNDCQFWWFGNPETSTWNLQYHHLDNGGPSPHDSVYQQLLDGEQVGVRCEAFYTDIDNDLTVSVDVTVVAQMGHCDQLIDTPTVTIR